MAHFLILQSWDLKPLIRELQGAGHHSRYQSGAGAVPATTLGAAAAVGSGPQLLLDGSKDALFVQWAASRAGNSGGGNGSGDGSGATTSRPWSPAPALGEEQKGEVEFPLPRLAAWRAHQEPITALDWLPVDSSGKPAVAAAPVTALSRPATAGRTVTAASVESARGAAAATAVVGGQTATADIAGGGQSKLGDVALGGAPAAVAPTGAQCMTAGVLGAAVEKAAAEGKGLARGYVVSAAFDCCLCLWTPNGVAVGTFGRDNWQLENSNSWKAQRAVPLTVRGALSNLLSCQGTDDVSCM
jgi:hypothetical protein